MTMNYPQIRAFALATPRTGYQNQITGALRSLADLFGLEYDENASFLLPEGCLTAADMEETIAYGKFADYESFKACLYKLLDAYLKKVIFPPKIFVTAYDMTEASSAALNADMLCRAVKDYYQEKNLGPVLTSVINGRLYGYKYVDLINVPKHLMTLRSRIKLLQDKKLRKKILFTLGTINNFNRRTVALKKKEFVEKLQHLAKDKKMSLFVEKFKAFQTAEKRVVFCLGGRVEGKEIIFDLAYMRHLYEQAERLVKNGFKVIFVNGPRTPNDVTDFLYETSLSNPHILFHNCKQIAQNDEERQPQKWRIYSGKYEKEFLIQAKIGNIYPAVLGFGNTLVVHTMDSYSGCETAGAAIPTAVSGKGIYIDPKVRYDCHNLYKILCPKYAVDFDEFVDLACNLKLMPDDLRLSVLPNPLRVFAETAFNAYNRLMLAAKKH